MKKNIYIPIEITHRELIPRLYLSYLLIKKGYRVFIGSKRGIFNFIKNKKDCEGIFFYKSAFSQEDKSRISFHDTNEITNLIKNCEHTIVLDEEMGIGMGYEPVTIEQRVTNLKYISKFFLIGNRLKNKIIKKNLKYKKIFVSTGWPKYDLNKSRFNNFYKTEAKKIKKEHGEFYLFSSNFGFLNKQKLSERLRKIKGNKKKYQNLKIVYKNAFKDYINFIKKINKFSNNPKFKIIIRPHPSDRSIQNWYRDVKQNRFVKVIYKNDITPWIFASKGLIHRGCSTSVDAYMIKKNIYYLKPNRKINKFEKNIPFKISQKIRNLNDISKFKRKKIKNFVSKSNLNFNIYNIANKDSSKEIIKQLNLLKVKKMNESKPNYFNIFKINLIEELSKILKIFMFKSRDNTNQKMPVQLSKKFISNQIINIMQKKDFRVKHIDFETYQISE